MNTTTNSSNTLWKILGVVVVVLIALAVIGPLLKGLFWIALIGLALYGGYVLLFRSRSKDKHPTPL